VRTEYMLVLGVTWRPCVGGRWSRIPAPVELTTSRVIGQGSHCFPQSLQHFLDSV